MMLRKNKTLTLNLMKTMLSQVKITGIAQFRGYIPLAEANETLNLLIVYSEPVMYENSNGHPITDVIRMEGSIGSEVLWDSRNSGGNFVRDTPAGSAEQTGYIQQSGPGLPESLDTRNAVHYTYQGSLPDEYCGVVQLYIGADDPSPYHGPRDLAGHKIDSSPISIPATRCGYESWANIGSFYPGYSTGIDANYIWGVPVWWCTGEIASAHVGSDVVIEIDLSNYGFGDEYAFITGCPYWFGFWLYDDETDECGFDIVIVKHDGSVIHNEFSTRYPKACVNEPGDVGWYGGPCYGPLGDISTVVSRDRRFFWAIGGNIALGEGSASSDFLVYCVDSWTGAKRTYCLGHCDSYSFSNSDYEGPPIWAGWICRIYKNGEAMVQYCSPDSPHGVYMYTVLDPPGRGIEDDTGIASSVLTENSVVTCRCDDSFSVSANPVHDELELKIAWESGESWNLAIYDISGRCVFSENGIAGSETSTLRISTANLSSGIYMVRAQQGENINVKTVSVVH